ncbi:MAG: hypothetical protein KDN19_04005 [Verrucomicrobiae bacterium]|nr:hypothetical protein [Verrucomicrobiae bacterium]
MSEESIEFIAPTSRAMGRMATILFRPFQIGKWFALGFSAWLATMLDGCSSHTGGGNYSGGGAGEEWEELKGEFQPVIDWMNENMELVVAFGAGLLVLILAIGIVLTWVSSRGKLMFLDNVVHNRALVSQPWTEFRAEGNSVFRWQLILGFGGMLVLLAVAGLSGWGLYSTYQPNAVTGGWIAGLIGAIVIFLFVAVVLAYFSFLFRSFVIVEVYKHRIMATEGWCRVLRLHGRRPASFVVFFLWSALLNLIAAFAILAVALLTCCIGAILMAIPYLGAVLLLPVSVFFQSLGPEFLRQFGPEHDLWENSLDPFGFEAAPPPLPPVS